MARVVMRYLVLAAIVLALAAPAARAETQLLYLAEDVPVSLDVDGTAATVNTSQVGRLNIQDPLVFFANKGPNEDGIMIPDFTKFEGRLAESWDFDAPSLTWTLHLRHGVISCAGNEFTADDVLYTFARAKSVSGQSTTAWFSGVVAGIKGFDTSVMHGGDKSLGDAVTAPDPYTVKFKQAGPDPFFLVALTLHTILVFDSKDMKKHATQDDPWSHAYTASEGVSGFGPYCMESWIKGDQFSVTANPHYWRGKPDIDRIVMKKVPQNSNRVVTLKAGQAQLVQGLTPREYAGLRGSKGVTVGGVYGNETLFLVPDFKSPLYGNPLIRQALAYGIDYDQVLKTGYYGQARRWEGLIPSSFPGSILPSTHFSYDPEKAKALLAQAGFPGGEGLDKFAEALKLTYASEREATLGPVATVIQTSLRGVGIPMVLDPIPQAQMAARRLVKHDLPLGMSDIDKAVAIDSIYATFLYFVSRDHGGIVNTNNYSDPEVDHLFDVAKATLAPEARIDIAHQIQELLGKDQPWIPIAETKTQWAYSSKLSGLTWYPDNSLRWFDLKLAK
jgi:peptide/nickel transport system substrate-binding protein